MATPDDQHGQLHIPTPGPDSVNGEDTGDGHAGVTGTNTDSGGIGVRGVGNGFGVLGETVTGVGLRDVATIALGGSSEHLGFWLGATGFSTRTRVYTAKVTSRESLDTPRLIPELESLATVLVAASECAATVSMASLCRDRALATGSV